MLKIVSFFIFLLLLVNFFSCKKDKFITNTSAKVSFSRDSVLFDTVFTTIGSSTRNIKVRNNNTQKIKISTIQLAGGTASAFKINVDGSPGTSFSDIEIAAKDSMYIFIQVNVNPTNINSPLIIRDSLLFTVNGNLQKVQLEAWGQDAYYHRPTDAITFKDGSYFPFSYLNNDTNAISVTWVKDKPHIIYGYLAVYTGQKLTIDAGVKVYMNNRAGLWIYSGGEIHINGQKGNEVVFQGVRSERTLEGTLADVKTDYTDEPGQWDRIWINEGSLNNEINYAIIKNGYIGIQAELFGNVFYAPKRLKITNTKIQNMSKWGLYALAFNIYGGNNVISNCQEQSVNLTLGGKYTFIHCTFANFWNKDKTREAPTLNINNHTDTQVLPLDSAYFGNCIIDGTLNNEINLDINASPTASLNAKLWFSNCWLKTNINTSNQNQFNYIVKSNSSLKYKDVSKYNFETDNENQVKGFTLGNAISDANKFMLDIDTKPRNTTSVTVGAYASQ
jgi:hypothetical protein